MDSDAVNVNVTVDDFDSVLWYPNQGDWQTPDPFSADYNADSKEWLRGTYHYTETEGASVSFNFTGPTVWVFGAAGPDYGDYEVRLDQVVLQRSAHQDSNATLPYVLYSAQNLTYDHHELTLSSRGNGGLLLDFIQTTVQLAPKGATVENQTLEETDGRIKYEGEWGNNQSGNFSGGGSTYTNGDGAYFELNFTASAIYVLGDKKNDHGLYEVTLSSNSSGSSSQVLSGVSGCGGAFGETCEQQLPSLKYFASNLANETYTLRLANIAGENNSYFDLDSIILSVPSEYDPRNLSSHDSIPTSSGASPSQTVGSGDSSSDNNSALALHNPLAVLVLSMLWLVRRWL
ncbi:uncharacterized protein SCHCODRAFT_02602681 [Schizophyllum commune H4-8]|uniref:Uncharacterized protein n=1 Tax=Schizophyllum commune (strain H4-8 / FGSC 9210) TaxID=578458 RepID=D8QH11_SCHCM|nr:uncharacterized protein SCHCODRAFT_02602681 [Schizophyllum commune H4-8]KAI5886975.1 hypothetical protein SCHCODRAFT_02602681 [Schizophyllum commune H4-8]